MSDQNSTKMVDTTLSSSLIELIEGVLADECVNGNIDMIHINVENLARKIASACARPQSDRSEFAINEEAIRKDDESGNRSEDTPKSLANDTLIEKLQRLADHLYSLDSDSGEAHLISETLMILRMRESVDDNRKKAIKMLSDMIDGGEECRDRDSEISRIIRILEGEAL
jgi:hypothetical protein